MIEEDRNQCQGCQAGWPLVKVDVYLSPVTAIPMYAHEVKGGYHGEKVTCTERLYVDEGEYKNERV